MNLKYFDIGTKVNIKPEAWKKFCLDENLNPNHPNPSPQYITTMPSHPPFHDKFLLTFPFYWWNEEDLEIVND